MAWRAERKTGALFALPASRVQHGSDFGHGVTKMGSRFSLSQVHPDDLRIAAALTCLLLAALLLTIASLAADPQLTAAVVLLDRQSKAFPYPLTVQNVTHMLFAIGVGEALVRFYSARDARRQLDKGLLPEGPALGDRELAELHEHVKLDGAGNDRHLHRLIHRIVVQYNATGSVGESQAVLDSSIEYFQHEIGLRYTMLRYLIWLLPTLGFIGTLVGISIALAKAGRLPDLEDPDALQTWINALTTNLGVAFYTTLVALTLSAVLVFLTSLATSREERALNDTGQYCLDNLINRLRNKRAHEAEAGSP